MSMTSIFRTYLLALVLFGLLPLASMAQVVDESTPKDTTWVGVGPDSVDFVAQSFESDIKRVRKIGVWLDRAAGTGEVSLMLVKDNGFGFPDMNFVLHASTLIQPDTAGGWVWDSTFSAVLTPFQRYWIVIDGYNNLQGSGYAEVGLSNSYTDTGESMRFSTDGGNNWQQLVTRSMAIHVEGDNCSFNLNVSPQQPLLCPGVPISFGVQSGYVSYAWSDGQTASTIYVNNTGIYTVTVVDVNNCVATASVLVVNGIVPTSGLLDDYETCANDPYEFDLPPFYSTYEWSTGQTGPKDTLTQSGQYWVHIISTSGCEVRDSFNLVVFPLPPLNIGTGDSLCAGDTVVLDAGPGFQNFLWSDNSSTQLDTLTATATVWLFVTDTNGCDQRSDTVTYGFYPVPSQPIIQELPTSLHSSLSNSYTWILDGDTIPGENAQDLPNPAPGLYSVIVTNAYGCSRESDTLRVVDAPVGDYVSRFMSPNADAYNDYFYVEGRERYPDLELIVFDRNGTELFYSKPYLNDWEGVGKGGKELPGGDYYFILNFGPSRETLQGNLYIAR
ncbi:MAG: gliding motility-associated C-terminal domain-containing protein [Bacteroidia bacterium]